MHIYTHDYIRMAIAEPVNWYLRPWNRQLMPWNVQIQYSYLLIVCLVIIISLGKCMAPWYLLTFSDCKWFMLFSLVRCFIWFTSIVMSVNLCYVLYFAIFYGDHHFESLSFKYFHINEFCHWSEFSCNLFFFKEKQIQIQKKHTKTYDTILIQLYTYKRHLIYKNTHFASLHWNFKHQGQFKMATTFYIYTLLWQRLFFFKHDIINKKDTIITIFFNKKKIKKVLLILKLSQIRWLKMLIILFSSSIRLFLTNRVL